MREHILMSMIENPPINHTTQPKDRNKRWITLAAVMGGLVILCVLACSILVGIRWFNTFKPKTDAIFYHNASIAHMFELCKPSLYKEWDAWMQAREGSDTVIALSYSKTSPVPDGFYAYALFVQIDSKLVATEQELSFPDEGIRAFLIETRAPFIACSSDLKGTINILSASDSLLTARLDVSGVINRNSWGYAGELEFKAATLPK